MLIVNWVEAATVSGEVVRPNGLAPPVGEFVDELVGQAVLELPALAQLPTREQLLLSAWLVSLRSARTRRAYFADLFGWLAFIQPRGVDLLAARRVHADLWVRAQLQAGAEASSVRRRLSALSSFYRCAAAHDLISDNPCASVVPPAVDPDYTATICLDRDQALALVAAADADTGPAQIRSAALIRLLLDCLLQVTGATGLCTPQYLHRDRVVH